MASFDVEGARKAGYSEAEIADHMAQSSGFDAAGARKAGYTDAEIITHVRAPVQSSSAAPSDSDKLLSSPPMRLAKGWKDPLDGVAQMAARTPGAGVVNRVADAVGGFLNRNIFNTPTMNRLMGIPEGTKADFAGEVLGIRGRTPEQLQQDVTEAETEYQAARRATAPKNLTSILKGEEADPRMDWMRLLGNMTSPVNLTLNKVLPVPAAGAPLRTVAAKGAIGGAAGAATQPVMGEDYWSTKAAQVTLGALAGGILTPAMVKAMPVVGRALDRLVRRTDAAKLTSDAIRDQVRQSLVADGIDTKSIPDAVFEKLSRDAAEAAQAGRKLDPTAAIRANDFKAVGIPFTRGQVTRDPAQWQKEFNLSGIEDAGDPIRDVLTAQSRGIADKFRQGSGAAADPFEAGNALMTQLQGANKTSEANVRAAYKAFRDATGKEMEVPMQGLAQDYAQALHDFGDSIPGSVRKQFDALGLLMGTQRKTLSVEDAEALIKSINKNYDPANRVSANALNELRGSLQKAITSAAEGDGAGAEAAHLANEARQMAAQRFGAIESTPALKAAIQKAEPDDFVRKYVIGGKVNEITRMQDLLDEEGRAQVRAQTIKYLEQKAFGVNAAGDGRAAQATFNTELNRIGRAKLVALLGEDGADEMQRVGRVLAYIKQVPEGATPNTSGTSQALLNAFGKLRGVGRLPWIYEHVAKPIAGYVDRRAAEDALRLPLTSPADVDPATERALMLLMGRAPLGSGIATGESIR